MKSINSSKKNILKYIIDKYNCSIIKNTSFPEKKTEFKKILKNTITDCKKKKINSIFLELSENQSNLIKPAIDLNFKFHFCKNSKIFLLKKFSDNEIPEFATHHIGVGAIVLNKNLNKILLVREKNHNQNIKKKENKEENKEKNENEKNGKNENINKEKNHKKNINENINKEKNHNQNENKNIIENTNKNKKENKERKNIWKIPTGRKNLGETISEGVYREIYEETKIEIDYLGILYFREFFPMTYGMGDFFL